MTALIGRRIVVAGKRGAGKLSGRGCQASGGLVDKTLFCGEIEIRRQCRSLKYVIWKEIGFSRLCQLARYTCGK